MDADRTELVTLNISLTAELREFVDGQSRLGGFHSVSEYMRDLLRRERRRFETERIERLLVEGLESGPPKVLTRDDLVGMVKEAASRYVAKGVHAKRQLQPRRRT